MQNSKLKRYFQLFLVVLAAGAIYPVEITTFRRWTDGKIATFNDCWESLFFCDFCKGEPKGQQFSTTTGLLNFALSTFARFSFTESLCEHTNLS